METDKVDATNSIHESEPQSRYKIHQICVYCGSSEGRNEAYQEAARDLGKEFAQRNIDLVYGGGSIGLMGIVSRTVKSEGGHVVGVMPKPLEGKEKTGDSIGEVIVVNSMHERKDKMHRLSDAFVTLPGGYGTLEEFFKVISWAQLGIHKKPVGLLNVGVFYDHLLHFIDLAVTEGLISLDAKNLLIVSPTVQSLLQKLEEHESNYDIGVHWPSTSPEDCLSNIEDDKQNT